EDEWRGSQIEPAKERLPEGASFMDAIRLVARRGAAGRDVRGVARVQGEEGAREHRDGDRGRRKRRSPTPDGADGRPVPTPDIS
ncbi:hypothetical protein THAOC_26617, partial [Thalassiosira oceanica]